MNVGTRIHTIQLINRIETNKHFSNSIGLTNKSKMINEEKRKNKKERKFKAKWKTNLLKH